MSNIMSNLKLSFGIIFVCSALIFVASPSHAKSKVGSCKEEAQKVCGNFKKAERKKCLQENASKLSPQCSGKLMDQDGKKSRDHANKGGKQREKNKQAS